MYDRLEAQLEDAETLHELAREVDDASQEAEIEGALGELDRALRALELRSMFSGEHDERDALCTIQAGERSEERRVGKECVRTGRSRGSQDRKKTKEKTTTTERSKHP